MSRTISRLVGAISLASLMAVVSACAGSGPTGSATTTPAAAQASAVSSSGTVLNLGDQQQNLEILLQASGALTDAPYKVNFIEFDSGPLALPKKNGLRSSAR